MDLYYILQCKDILCKINVSYVGKINIKVNAVL